MIVVGLSNQRVFAVIVVSLWMLSACAREHEKAGAGAGDQQAIQNEDDASGGTGGTGSAAGQGGSDEQAEMQPAGGTSAQAAADAGSVVVNPDETPSSATDAGEGQEAPVPADAGTHESFEGCRGPSDPGCAVCKEHDGSSYSSASSGADWYNVSSVDGSCGADCPVCASCSYRAEASAIELGHRPECEPCGDPGIDPCFGAGSCECYCDRKASLSEACPTLF